MKKFLVIIVFVILSLGIGLSSSVLAQVPACDLCGFCQGGTVPSDYEACTQCLYEIPATVAADGSITTPPSKPHKGSSWTVISCLPTEPGPFAQTLLQFTTAIIGGVVFIMFLYGGFQVLTSSGDPERVASGKKLVTSSILAIIIVIFAVFIMQFVGVQILKVPGFEG